MNHNIVPHSGRLLVTELLQWPKKPNWQPVTENEYNTYQRELAAALSQSIPIVDEDYERVKRLIRSKILEPNRRFGVAFTADELIQDGTIYSVDVELEKVEQFKFKNHNWEDIGNARRDSLERMDFVVFRTALRLKDVKQEKPIEDFKFDQPIPHYLTKEGREEAEQELNNIIGVPKELVNPQPDKELPPPYNDDEVAEIKRRWTKDIEIRNLEVDALKAHIEVLIKVNASLREENVRLFNRLHTV